MGRVSELFNKAIEDFLKIVPGFKVHIDDKANPHGTTKVQVGLSEIDNIKQATKAEFNAHKADSVLDHPNGSVTTSKIADGAITSGKIASNSISIAKISDGAITSSKLGTYAVTETKINSSAVTNSKIADNAVSDAKIGSRTIKDPSASTGNTTGLLTALLNGFTDTIRSLRNLLNSHTSNTANPHLTTKEQIGLSNITNNAQATKAEYMAHIEGIADNHTADDIEYDRNLSVKGKIENLILTEMGGIPDHTHTGEAADTSKVSYLDLVDKPVIKDFAIRIASSEASEDDKALADYVCTGVNDEVIINTAIQSLTNGGTISLSTGTFYAYAPIVIGHNKNNITLAGEGKSSIIKRMFSSSGEIRKGVIYASSGQAHDGCRIACLMIDGNRANFTSSYNDGFFLAGDADSWSISNVTVFDCAGTGIRFGTGSSSSDIKITNNVLHNNNSGISLDGLENSFISGNFISGCTNYMGSAIYAYGGGDLAVVNNICKDNAGDGIELEMTERGEVSGNISWNNGVHQILIDSTNNTIVSGNICFRGAGEQGDYTSNQYTIRVQRTYTSGETAINSLIISNFCMGKAIVVSGLYYNVTEINNIHE